LNLHRFTTLHGDCSLEAAMEMLAFITPMNYSSRDLFDKLVRQTNDGLVVKTLKLRADRDQQRTEAYIPSYAVLEQRGEVWIVIGGTAAWIQWGQNASGFFQQDYLYDEGIYVHGYFQWCAQAIRGEIGPVYGEKWKEKKLHIAGHSLGGATAQLLAYAMHHDFGCEDVELMTIGQPRAVAAGYEGWQPPRYWRISNDRDVVTYLPFKNFPHDWVELAGETLPLTRDLIGWAYYDNYGTEVYSDEWGAFGNAVTMREAPEMPWSKTLFEVSGHAGEAYQRRFNAAYKRYGGDKASARLLRTAIEYSNSAGNTGFEPTWENPHDVAGDLDSTRRIVGLPASKQLTTENIKTFDVVYVKQGEPQLTLAEPPQFTADRDRPGAARQFAPQPNPGGIPVAHYAVTLIFTQGRNGWTETSYLANQSAAPWTIDTAKKEVVFGTDIMKLAQLRSGLLGIEAYISGIRAGALGVAGEDPPQHATVGRPFGSDSFVEFYPHTMAGSPPAKSFLNAADPFNSFVFEMRDASMKSRRVQHLRGLPQSWLQVSFNDPDPEGPLTSAGREEWEKYRKFLAGGENATSPWALRVQATGVAVSTTQIRGVSVHPTSRAWMITVPGQQFSLNEDVLVRNMVGKGAGMRGINGRATVVGLDYDDANDLQTLTLNKDQCAECALRVKKLGTVSRYGRVLVPIAVAQGMYFSHRQTGRAFLPQRGRRAKRGCC
jgi:hypothetical protein